MSYWRLGEASGTTALDSKSTNNGTYVNGVTLGTTGAIANDANTAASFNGSTQRVSLPTLATVTDFTIEGWTNLANGATANVNGNNALYAGSTTVRLLVRPGSLNTTTNAYAGV